MISIGLPSYKAEETVWMVWILKYLVLVENNHRREEILIYTPQLNLTQGISTETLMELPFRNLQQLRVSWKTLQLK